MQWSTTNTTVQYSAAPLDGGAGRKDDQGKLRYDLVSAAFEDDLAAVLTKGAEKYGPNNWQGVENGTDRYYAALRRHISAWRQGEQADPEDGLPHLAHAAANIMFLMHFEKEGK